RSYWLEVSRRGCKGRDSTLIYLSNPDPALVYIPDAFTPNMDDLNEQFPFRDETFSYELQIFNILGEKIYQGNSNWDGPYEGEPVQQGVYVYVITVWDCSLQKSFYRGTVTLLK